MLEHKVLLISFGTRIPEASQKNFLLVKTLINVTSLSAD